MTTIVRLGSFTPSVLLRVARRLGRLESDVVEELVPSSPAQFRALIDGRYDAVLTSPDNVLAYRYSPVNPLGEHAGAEMVAAVDRGMGLALYSNRDDLRGARLAVDVPGSGFAFAMYALAESLGLRRGDYEVIALGSTPKRLQALLAGECDATMLNAGNELLAEAAGFRALARASEVCHPYLGTVLAALDPAPVTGLASALTAVAAEITGGRHDQLVADEATAALGLDRPLAERYLQRLRTPAEGLVPDGVVDRESLRTLVGLRRRFGPALDGDPLSAALT
ncbi:PhnD/SsuA/transferrin family substrate-binding protein [Actinoplanes sp. NPDC051861]|uniref:ABC transporter substrate-binding protein n=1 Tax=Actinoplanes sp. NPDC051861 TaxID=3155170 RepID=UPI00341A0FC4